MSVHPSRSDAGYSPPLHIELQLHGHRFAVAELGSTFLRLRDAVAAPPGPGIVRVEIDGRPIEYRVDVVDGIDPRRKRQPCRPASAAVAAAGPTLTAVAG